MEENQTIAIADSKDNSKLEFEMFKKVVVYTSSTASLGKRYLNKLLSLALLSGLMIAWSIFSLVGGLNIASGLLAVFALAPALFILFLRSRLSDVESLPVEVEKFEQSAIVISQKLREKDFKSVVDIRSLSEEVPFRKRLKLLTSLAPMLFNFKSQLGELFRPQMVVAIMSVVNPFYGFCLLLAIFITLVWLLLMLIVGLIALIF